MIDVDKLDDEVLACIISNIVDDPDDDAQCDAAIEKVKLMDKVEALDRWLQWHGLVGWTDQILKAAASIDEAGNG